MNGIKIILCLLLITPVCGYAQDFSLSTDIQKISNGGLYYEYCKHTNETAFPTIVFESGALNSSSYWDPVMDSIYLYANTIRYDRAGLGRSLASTDTIRSSIQIAKELNELLDSLKIKEKIILVCHSAGGFYGRTFSHQYSERVKALVLMESPCTQWESLLRSSLTNRQNEDRDATLRQNRLALPYFQQLEYQASEINRDILDKVQKMDIPVYIIYGNGHHWPDDYDADALNEKWKACQSSLIDISSKSKSIVVNGAGHHLFRAFNLSRFLKKMMAELN